MVYDEFKRKIDSDSDVINSDQGSSNLKVSDQESLDWA